MGNDGGSGAFWGIVVATTVAIGFGVSILAGYLIGHFTGNEKTVTTVVTAATRPADGDPDSAAASEGIGVSIRPAPAFDRETLAALPRSNWLTNGGSLSNQRYSPLTQINDRNIAQVRGLWEARFDRSGTAAKYSAEATPVVYDGVIYTVTGNNDVFANAVEDGRRLWKYESGIPQNIDTICCGWTSRGVAVGDGRIYSAQLDGKLIALDQRTGQKEWEYTVGDWRNGETLTNAPLYYDGRVYTGVSGGEYGIRGRLTAVDARTGKLDWRFWTIPAPNEPGSETWPDNDAWRNGGAPVWQTPAVDPELNTLYFSTGNVAPDLNGVNRKGDNLYGASIVALDATTGRHKWHFQQVRHDIWDYDAPSPVVLWDAEVDGREVKGLSQPSKTGWLYMLDRETGRPIHGITDRPVMQDKARQQTADTQPFPDTPPFVPHEITDEQVAIIQGILDSQTRGRRRVRVEVAREMYEPFGSTPKVIKPGPSGGTNWPPSSFNRTTNMVYICGADTFAGYMTEGPSRPIPGRQYLSSVFTLQGFGTYPGVLVAQDVTTGEIAWSRRFTGSNDACYSGTTSTAGNLVFVGRNNGELQAFNASTGEIVWRFQTGAGANSTPAIFEHRGRQMIAFYAGGNSLAGSAHGDSLWLFSLDGRIGPVAPGAASRAIEHAGEAGTGEVEEEATTIEPDADRTTESDEGGGAAAVVDGAQIFSDDCSVCHGADGTGGNGGPDLTTIPSARDVRAVERQVANGGNGMPAFRDTLSPEEIRAVSVFVTRLVR
jgi:alcohol dehydrogenase (cytochrome c)